MLALCVLALCAVGCEDERRSSSGGGGGGGGAGGGGGGGNEPGLEGHVLPGERDRGLETDEAKTQRVIRQTTNQLLGAMGPEGAPADQDAAAEALATRGLSWVTDPWGKPYVYRKTGPRSFEIFSAGPDGQEGTADDVRAD